MNNKRLVFRSNLIFGDEVEIMVPEHYKKVVTYNNPINISSEYLVWKDEISKDVFSVSKITEMNSQIDCLLMSLKSQLVKNPSKVNNIAFYTAEEDGNIEKVLAEDEIFILEKGVYIISSIVKYNDIVLFLYYAASNNKKKEIKENMLFMIDTIGFNLL